MHTDQIPLGGLKSNIVYPISFCTHHFHRIPHFEQDRGGARRCIDGRSWNGRLFGTAFCSAALVEVTAPPQHEFPELFTYFLYH